MRCAAHPPGELYIELVDSSPARLRRFDSLPLDVRADVGLARDEALPDAERLELAGACRGEEDRRPQPGGVLVDEKRCTVSFAKRAEFVSHDSGDEVEERLERGEVGREYRDGRRRLRRRSARALHEGAKRGFVVQGDRATRSREAGREMRAVGASGVNDAVAVKARTASFGPA